MNKENKKTFVDEMNQKIEELKIDLDHMGTEIKNSMRDTQDVTTDMLREEITELESLLNRIQNSADESWEDMKEDIIEMWETVNAEVQGYSKSRKA